MTEKTIKPRTWDQIDLLKFRASLPELAYNEVATITQLFYGQSTGLIDSLLAQDKSRQDSNSFTNRLDDFKSYLNDIHKDEAAINLARRSTKKLF